MNRTTSFLRAAGLVTATLLFLACGYRAGAPASAATPSSAQLLYACSQDAAVVSVIDMERGSIVATIDLQALGFPATAKPHHTVVEPDGSHWYLSLIGANRVLKFDRANRLVGQAEFAVPGMLALHPTEDLLFVGRSMSAVNPPRRIGIIRRSSMTVEEVDVFYPRPHALAVHPGGEYVYTASLTENQVMTVSVPGHDVAFQPVAGHTHVFVQFAFSPNGRQVVVGGEHSNELLVFDATRPPALTLIKTIPVNARPWHPVFTPDGRFLYFGNKGANTVTVVDAQSWEVARVIEHPAIAEPHGAAVSADGRYVYVSSNNLKETYAGRDGGHPGTVVAINTVTHAVERVIEIPPGATGLGTRAP